MIHSDIDHSWGTELNGAESIVDLVLEMLRRGTPQLLGYKSDIYWPVDIESIHEAINEACIIEGLDEDYYSPVIHCDGPEYEIRLY